MSNQRTESTRCRIDRALGHDHACSGEVCPFWETRAGISPGRCVFEKVDLSGRVDLAQWLADLRNSIVTGASQPGSESRRLFYERLNAGRSD